MTCPSTGLKFTVPIQLLGEIHQFCEEEEEEEEEEKEKEEGFGVESLKMVNVKLKDS